ncbi:MAG: cobalamin biosynthesis protein [Lachnospiraceae bacterium]
MRFLYPSSDSEDCGLRARLPERKEEAAIEEAVLEALSRNRLSIHSLMGAASVDLKAEEPGILAFCEKYGLDFQTYSAEELSEAEGDFTPRPS